MAGVVNIGIIEATAILRDEMSSAVTGMRASLKSFSEDSAKSFAAIGQAGALIVAGVTAAGAAIVALGSRGAAVADVRSEFDGLTSSIGLSADALSKTLRDATGGVISNFETMVTVNRAISGGLRLTNDEFGQLGEGARVLANRVGGDTKEAFDKLTEAMTTGRTKALKAYGVDVVALEVAVKNAGDGLSDFQKIQIKQKELFEQLSDATKAAGDITLDFAERIDAGKAAVQNFMDDIGVAISESPALAVAMDGIADAIAAAFGNDQGERVKAITDLVNQFAIMIADGISVVLKFADFAQKAFFGTRAMLFGLLESIFDLEVGLRDVAIATAEYANMIPGMRGDFDSIIQAHKDARDVSAAMGKSFGETKDAALDSSANMSAGFAKAQDTIAKLREKMVEASASTVEHTRVTRDIKAAVDEHAVSEKERVKAMKEAEKAADSQRAALQSLGIVTRDSVNKEMAEWHTLIARATAEGVAYDKVIAALWPDMQKFAAQAKASGISVDALTREMDEFQSVINSTFDAGFERDMDQGLEALLAAGGGIKQIDFNAVQARLSADQLTKAYADFGLKTPTELKKAAAEAEHNYAILKSSGVATTRDLKDAYEKMVEAQNLASGKLPGFWKTTVVPGIVDAVGTLQTAISGSFAQMLIGAKGFGDGFKDIWESIKHSAINIFNQIAEAFIQGALKRIIGALTGAQGGVTGGLGGLLQSALGGSPGIPGIGALVGGAAPIGLTGAASSPSIAAAGLGLGGGTGAAGGASVGGILSSAVVTGALGAAGAAAAGIGIGLLAKRLTGGAGAAAGGIGAAGGAATGALIGSVVPGIGTAVGAIVGGVAGALSGFLGVSKTEKAGRSAVAEIEETLRASLTAQQTIEAGGERWKEVLIPVRDAYLAIGLSGQQAEEDVKRLWASSKGGAAAVEQAVAPIQAAFDKLAEQKAAEAIENGMNGAAAATENATQQAQEFNDEVSGMTTRDSFEDITVSAEIANKKIANATQETEDFHAGIDDLGGATAPIDALAGSYENLINRIRQAAEENRLFRSDWHGGEGFTPNTEAVPMAEGGVAVRPVHALIGESGAEAVIPLDQFTQGSGVDQEQINRLNQNIESFMHFLPGLLTRSLRDANRGAAVAH